MDWEKLPLLLKVRDLQNVLNVSKTTAYELVNSKNFPAVRVGRCFRVPRESLKQWLEKQTAGK
jgi:excisionase family DNA binding protein